MTTPPEVARAAIERELLAWMKDEPGRHDEPRFERLALALFAFQFERNAAYGRLCTARGKTPATVASWREIPAVPTGAFKELAQRCFPAERSVKVFRTAKNTTPRGENGGAQGRVRGAFPSRGRA